MYADNNNRAQIIKTLEMWKFFCYSSEKKCKLQLTCESVSKSDIWFIWLFYDFEYKISKVNQLIQIIK